MPTQKAMYRRAILLSGALVLAVCTTSALAQQKMKVSGKMTMTIAKHDSVTVEPTRNHYLLLSRSVGTNASTGEHKFMDGAKAVNASFADLAQGNGPEQGYAIFSQDGSSITCQWEGRVTTAPGKDAPVISFEGTFTWTHGTGQFANIRGAGTFKGHYTSQTTYEADWMGEYLLGK